MIVVLGALNIDVMMTVGNFPKFGETVLCTDDYISRPGGKGSNQAVAAAKADAKVAMIGKVGDDSFGRRSVKNLKSSGIWTSGIGMSESRPTGCSAVLVDSTGHNMVIAALGANLEVTADQVPDEILTEKNILLASLETVYEETFDVFKRARLNRCTTILNASPANNIEEEILYNVDYLIINEIESQQIAEKLRIMGTGAGELARKFSDQFTLTCIITLEEKGAIAASKGVLYTIPTLGAAVVDSTGAGDTFCGVFAACLQKGIGWVESMHYASAGAGLSCLGLGAQDAIPTMDDIKERLKDVRPPQKLDI